MSARKYITPGPIGTKLGTFIVNENLEIINKHIPLSLYDKYLIDSINLGISWFHKRLTEHKVDEKFFRHYDKFVKLINNSAYSDELNQGIIEATYDLNSKLNHIETPVIQHIEKKRVHHLGPDSLNNITEKDIDLTRGLMVQTTPGKYELFLYVRHLDHYDTLPYEYISEKIRNLPNLLYNGYKLN
jgi:hypothetical protein